MPTLPLCVEKLEKFFPPAFAGWRAFLHPLARLTVPALRGVSFEVSPGEVMALVGANGAGKSTLLRILTTLLLPTSGRAWVGGMDVATKPAAVRRLLGFYNGSDTSFYARLTGRENLLLFASLNNLSLQEADSRITQLGRLLDLDEPLNRQVRLLSTGNVHRLGLARALLHRPKLLILDEPTRSLDPFAASAFRRFLREEIIRQEGTTLLFATHTLAEAEFFDARLALLHRGELLACDTAPRLRTRANSDSLQEALESLIETAGSAR